MFYSPVLQISYDGIFRLRDLVAKDSLLSTFKNELHGNHALFDLGRTQSHGVRHSEDSPPKKEYSKTILHQYIAPSEARFKVTFSHECTSSQLALHLHQAVQAVRIFTMPVWTPVRIVTL